MTYDNVFEMLEELGVPVAYYQFDGTEENPAPHPPFLCFFYTGSDDLIADNVNYQAIRALAVELYTDDKDFALEARLEGIFTAHGLSFQRDEAFVESESMYQITYRLEVVINA